MNDPSDDFKSLKEKPLVTTSGRVCGALGLGKTLEEARVNAYQNIRQVWFQGMQYRSDIGLIEKNPQLPDEDKGETK